MDRKARFALAWWVGLALGVGEALRAGTPAGRAHWGFLALTLGILPLAAGAWSLLLSVARPLRSPERFLPLLVTTLVLPWAAHWVFPRLTVGALMRPGNWAKLLPLVLLCVMGGREMARWAWVRRGGLGPVWLGWSLLTVGAGAALLLPSPPPPRFQAHGQGPNVVLLSLDTVRRDALSCFGAPPGHTPTLDSLAASGIRFTRVTSTAPWTLASVASFMTGLYPSTIRVWTGRQRLGQEVTTMAEAFLAKGYHTHAVVTNVWLRPELGVDQGFQVFDHPSADEDRTKLYAFSLFRLLRRLRPPDPYPRDSADEVVDRALAFLASGPPQPFFLWLHFNDAHDPYAPPDAFLPRDPSYRGPFLLSSGSVIRLRQGNRLSLADRRRLMALYHAEVRYLDSCLGRFLAGLRELGYGDALVAVVSDHGEEFWEHGGVGHGHSLHGELLWVPFVLSWPGRLPGGTVDSIPRALVDLYPTLAELVGLPCDAQGISALASPPRGRPLLAEALEFFTELKAIHVWPWKLVVEPDTGRRWLFNQERDPDETINLAPQFPDTTAWLAQLLSQELASLSAAAELRRINPSHTRLSPALREQLRAQGYLE